MYAPAIRYHSNHFYVACEYISIEAETIISVIFKSTNPFDDAAWGEPVIFHPDHIDPNLFWDDDGKGYMATHGITLREINLESGEIGDELNGWNELTGVWPEGPHIYKKDDWYYLMIAESGTEANHSIKIARAYSITGPYSSYENNPILTSPLTNELFQTVGHGDLFQNDKGDWWGMCLSTRTGPGFKISPMGREAVLSNVTWDKSEGPTL